MIWTRYLYKETGKVFTLIFFSLFFLVMCIDYAAHMKTFLQEGVTFIDVAFYYLDQLSQQAELLAGVALLLSCVHVVTTLNRRGEIVAMAASGVHMHKLLAPFLHIALFLTTLLYLNAQFFQPLSITHLRSFEDRFFKSSSEEMVHSLLLEDHTTLLYQKYEPSKRQFFDVFWVINHNEVYRCKYLSPFVNIPYGTAVDKIVRNRQGELGVEKSFEKLEFPQMHFDSKLLEKAVVASDQLSITALLKTIPPHPFGLAMRDDEARALASLCHKLTAPLALLLAVLAPIPFCLHFGRRKRLFLTYAFALAGMVFYFVCINTTVIMGKGHMLPPFWIVTLPPLIALTFFGMRYARL